MNCFWTCFVAIALLGIASGTTDPREVIVGLEGAAAAAAAVGESSWNTTSSYTPSYVSLYLGGKKQITWLNQTALIEELRSFVPIPDGEPLLIKNLTQEHSGITAVLELATEVSANATVLLVMENRSAFAKTNFLRYAVGAFSGVKTWEGFFGDEGDPKFGKVIAIVVPTLGTVMLVVIIVVMVVLAIVHYKRGGAHETEVVEGETEEPGSAAAATTSASGATASGASAATGSSSVLTTPQSPQTVPSAI